MRKQSLLLLSLLLLAALSCLLLSGCSAAPLTLPPLAITITGQETTLDLSAVEAAYVEQLIPNIAEMPNLKSIDLGDAGDAAAPRIPWETVKAIEEARPDVTLQYKFVLYGKPFDLQSTAMDLNHLEMFDEGALVKKVALCMPQLSWLDMDFCGVSDEAMADIRDSLPNAEVVWRIWFGKGIYGGYSVRTNVTKILASNPDKAGELNPETTRALKYCTKVKYLDLGHNDQLSDISFCAYMPELEVAIFANGRYHDLTPLTHCPNLEYLELQYGAVSDLSPLAELKNLRHLNIAWNFTLMDISPLYDLDLERLWIGEYNPVSPAQVAEMQRRHPDCEINTTTADYEELRRQFEYDSAPYCYSYLENDPLYYPHP